MNEFKSQTWTAYPNSAVLGRFSNRHLCLT